MKNSSPRLKELRDQLHKLHGAFLEALKYRHERTEGHQINATQWFMILTQDPNYAWSRSFTRFITEVDIILDEPDLTEEKILDVGKKTDALFSPGIPENLFASRFLEMVPQEPELMMLYHGFREARKKLMQPIC